VYTQCPQCQTQYRVSAELLRAARGQVQCGRCAIVFDALTFLIEEEPFDGPAHQPKPTASDPAQWQTAAPPTEISERPRDEPPFDPEQDRTDHSLDRSLEFDLPADAVDRVFIEAPKLTMPTFPSVAAMTDAAAVSLEPDDPVEDIEISLTVEDPSNDPTVVEPETELVDEPPQIEGEHAWDPEDVAEPEPEEVEPEAAMPTHVIEDEDATVIAMVDPGEPANDDRGMSGARTRYAPIAVESASEDHMEFGDTAILRERALHYGWRIGAGVLTFMLLVQFVHYDRHELVRRPTVGPLLQKIYARLGLQLSPNWNLKAYQVRQWGATAAPGAQGTLRVRASVVNTADHAQPLPLLRLSLADIAGARVGVRDFEPGEYVPNLPESDHMLDAGRRIDAEVVIVDPGKDAVGFEIDVCLRDDERHINCANDPAPAG
jgi:predicted Zn finger-like uncharacterized protein